jgi:DNA-binding NarL/FixJ family response regulator
MIKVLLVEDDARLRNGWQRLFAPREDMRLVGTLDRADDLEQAVAEHEPDIVVIDLSMPGRDPVEAVRALSATHGSIRPVIYSAHSDPGLMREVFDAGAWAFVDKLRPPAELFDTLRRVWEGELVLPAALEPG